MVLTVLFNVSIIVDKQAFAKASCAISVAQDYQDCTLGWVMRFDIQHFQREH